MLDLEQKNGVRGKRNCKNEGFYSKDYYEGYQVKRLLKKLIIRERERQFGVGEVQTGQIISERAQKISRRNIIRRARFKYHPNPPRLPKAPIQCYHRNR